MASSDFILRPVLTIERDYAFDSCNVAQQLASFETVMREN